MALVARIDIALAVIVEDRLDHLPFVIAERKPRRHRRLAHALAAVNRERGVRRSTPPLRPRPMARFRSSGPYLRRDGADIQPVRRQQIIMAAVIVDEGILQRERVEPAARLDVPGDLLGLRRQAALRRMLLDDDDVPVPPQRVADALDVERLHRMARDDGDRFALRLESAASCIAFCMITP